MYGDDGSLPARPYYRQDVFDNESEDDYSIDGRDPYGDGYGYSDDGY